MKHLIFTLCMIAFCYSCGTTKKSSSEEHQTVAIRFSADSAYLFCEQQCQFGPRTMNSEAHELCAQWIAGQFKQYGCEVELQQADLKGYDGTMLKSTNIIARTQPAANSQQASRILICAHWDSRPWADNDPDSTNWHKPVMAANDGASGVGIMLELARLIQANDSLPVPVDFVCFDAEDWGVPQWSDAVDNNSWALGAQHWAESMKGKGATYQYGILLDMVGGQGAKFYHEGNSMQYARSIVERVWQAAGAAGYGSFFVAENSGGVIDDHVPVNQTAGIPCIDIINHYPDCQQSTFGPTWHTVNDDMQHLDKNTLEAVGQTLVQLLFQK